MTRHRHAQTGLVTPSPLDRWIDATLRVFAMLVLNVAATLQMIVRRGPVIGTQPMPSDLPRKTRDTHKEQHAVPQDSSLNSAHGEQRSSAARPSNHERVLTTLSHTSPSPSVSLTTSAIHLPLLRRWRQTALRRLRLRGIAATAFGGGSGSPRSGLTEGESHRRHSLRSSRASRVMCIQTGLRQQPSLPACAGPSGISNPPNRNAAA